MLRTAAALLQGHHGSAVPQVVAAHCGMSGAWNGAGCSTDWHCKWCKGSDGSSFRNNKDKKSCHRCHVSKSYAFKHPNSLEVKKPSTSLAERQVLAEKTDSRKQLLAQRRRIEVLEKQLSAKQAGGTEEEAAIGPVAEEVSPARLAARQQRTQKLLAEAQAEGLLGSLDISSMPWTKVVVPKAVETAESLHKEAKGKYSSAWGR